MLNGLSEGAVSLAISDQLGRVVFEKNLETSFQNTGVKVPVQNFLVGEYFVKVTNGRNLVSKVLVVQH